MTTSTALVVVPPPLPVQPESCKGCPNFVFTGYCDGPMDCENEDAELCDSCKDFKIEGIACFKFMTLHPSKV